MVRGGIRGREMEDLGCRPKLEDLPAVRQKWVIFWSPPIPTFTASIQSRNTASWDENQYLTICSTYSTYIIWTLTKWEQAPSGEWNVPTWWLNKQTPSKWNGGERLVLLLVKSSLCTAHSHSDLRDEHWTDPVASNFIPNTTAEYLCQGTSSKEALQVAVT